MPTFPLIRSPSLRAADEASRGGNNSVLQGAVQGGGGGNQTVADHPAGLVEYAHPASRGDAGNRRGSAPPQTHLTPPRGPLRPGDSRPSHSGSSHPLSGSREYHAVDIIYPDAPLSGEQAGRGYSLEDLESLLDSINGALAKPLPAALRNQGKAGQEFHNLYEQAGQLYTQLEGLVADPAARDSLSESDLTEIAERAGEVVQALGTFERSCNLLERTGFSEWLGRFTEYHREKRNIDAFIDRQEKRRAIERRPLARASEYPTGGSGRTRHATETASNGADYFAGLNKMLNMTEAVMAEYVRPPLVKRTVRDGASPYPHAAAVGTAFNWLMNYTRYNNNFGPMLAQVAGKFISENVALSDRHKSYLVTGKYPFPFMDPFVDETKLNDPVHLGTINIAHMLVGAVAVAGFSWLVTGLLSRLVWRKTDSQKEWVQELRYHFANPAVQKLALVTASLANVCRGYLAGMGGLAAYVEGPDSPLVHSLGKLGTIFSAFPDTKVATEMSTLTAVARVRWPARSPLMPC